MRRAGARRRRAPRPPGRRGDGGDARRSACTSRPAWPRPSTGPRRSPSSARASSTSTRSTRTLGTVLKYREDQAARPRRRPRRPRRPGRRAQRLTSVAPAPDPDAAAVAFARSLRQAGLVVPDRRVDRLRRRAGPRRPRRRRRRLLGGPGHARATARGRRRLRRSCSPRYFGSVPLPAPTRQVRRAASPSPWTTPTRTGGEVDEVADAAPRSRSASAGPRCCGTRTSPPTTTPSSPRPGRAHGRLRVVGAPRRSRRAVPTSRDVVARTCAARSATPCAPAASRSGGRHTAPGERPGGWCCWSTSAGRWRPTPRALLRFAHAAVAATQPGRGLRPRHPAHPPHPGAARPRPRRRAAAGGRGGGRLAGGTRLGEGLRALQRRVGRAGHGPGRRGRDPLRRLGPRRPGGAGRADGAAAARGPPGRVGEPAQGVAGLRAARTRHGGGAAARRRVRRGPQLDALDGSPP